MEHVAKKLRQPNDARIFYIGDAIRLGISLEQIQAWTSIDKWFLENIKEIVDFESSLKKAAGQDRRFRIKIIACAFKQAKVLGFSDKQLCGLFGVAEDEVSALLNQIQLITTYKLI